MIVITENNYKLIEKIPQIENTSTTPNAILYQAIFNAETIEKIRHVLDSLKYVQIRTNSQEEYSQTWLTENSTWIYDRKIQPQQFPPFLELIKKDIQTLSNISVNACLIIKYKEGGPWNFNGCVTKWLGTTYSIPSVFIGAPRTLTFLNKKNNNSEQLDIVSGSVLIQRDFTPNEWDLSLISNDKNTGICYQMIFRHVYSPGKKCTMDISEVKIAKTIPLKLSSVYLKPKYRGALRLIIRKGLEKIHEHHPEGKQCVMTSGINKMKKYIDLKKLIGTGDWGNVYSAYLAKDPKCFQFAIKMSRIDESDLEDPYTETSSSWYEIWMLKDIFKPIIAEAICPNLPLFIDTFLCNKCDFVFRKGDKSYPCIITVIEMASGDLQNYFKSSSATDKEIYSALFQIMAGLHAIQMNGQIMNNDIKAKNILYYNVKPGGYWKYKLNGKNFYVPNYGKMFVLNDFGVSTLYDPNFQLYPNKYRNVFNLGSRYAINIDGQFSPIESLTEYNKKISSSKTIQWTTDENNKIISRGATFKLDRETGRVLISRTKLTPFQKSYLFKKGITTNPKTWDFFENPSIIPPFEFYNDVQDVLRTFVGGKRTTQNGCHSLYNIISQNVINSITPYLGEAQNASERKFSTNAFHVLAGAFIEKFFTENQNYRKKPLTSLGKRIYYYDMDKCLNFKNY